MESMLCQVKNRLSNHGHFHSHKAYCGYSAKISIEFTPVRSYSPPLVDEFTVEEKPELITIQIDPASPNQVREDAGLDMPIQVEENGMIVEKMVPAAKYKGKTARQKPPSSNMSIPQMSAKHEIERGLVERYGIQTP
jgi:hypothetical protein